VIGYAYQDEEAEEAQSSISGTKTIHYFGAEKMMHFSPPKTSRFVF
jgi:hypothetical protein